MDLGISGRTALACASSQGLGLACAQSLAAEGVNIILNGRDRKKLETAALSLSEYDVGITTICADLTTKDGREKIILKAGKVDILVNNNAGPPPGALEDWDYEALIDAMNANMIPATLLIRAFMPSMREQKFGRIINITSAMVKSPHPLMGLSTSARAALTAMSKSISRDVIIDNVTINNLLPERIDTPRQEYMAQRIMKEKGIDRDSARQEIVNTIAAKRFGTPKEFADTCAYLCSAQAGFISGQNIQIDGGSYEGLI